MPPFDHMPLPTDPTTIAPDGCNVRVLLATERGSMAHFELPPGQVSQAVVHRTIDELWYFLSGTGEMWRKLGDQEETVAVKAGDSLSIPVGTYFQFRTTGDDSLTAVGVAMPPWSGMDEAIIVAGIWTPTLDPGT